jgi:hypothetical protein
VGKEEAKVLSPFRMSIEAEASVFIILSYVLGILTTNLYIRGTVGSASSFLLADLFFVEASSKISR